MPPAGYPAFLQYLQSGRVRKIGRATAYGVTVNRVFHEQPLRQVIHGQGPEIIHRRDLVRREVQHITLAAIERIAFGVGDIALIHGLLFGVVVDAHRGANRAFHGVVFAEKFSRAEELDSLKS